MRTILISVLLIIVIAVLYTHIFGGEDGIVSHVREGGGQLNKSIEKINMYGEEAVR